MVSKNIIFKQYYVEKLWNDNLFVLCVDLCCIVMCIRECFFEKFGLCFT